MSRSLLALCRDVIADLGVAGGTLQSVSTQLGLEQTRIVNWVARADLVIQNLWADWSFLWYHDPAVTAQPGSSSLAATLPAWADNIQSIDRNSLWQNYGLVNARRVPFLEWPAFNTMFQSKPKATLANPPFFSRDPTGQLWLSHNVTDTTLFALDYYVVSKRMSADGSVSPIPNNFDLIICERAKMYYAQRENAPEIMTGSTAEYMDALDKMQAYCLPDNLAGRRLRNDAAAMPVPYVE